MVQKANTIRMIAKLVLALSLIVLFTNSCFSQDKDPPKKEDEKPKYKHKFNIDFSPNPSIAYSHRVSKKWFLGGGVGYKTYAYSVNKSSNAQGSGTTEWMSGYLFGRYKINWLMSFDVGLRGSAFMYEVSGDEEGAGTVGGYLDLMIGFWFFKVGSRLVFGQYNFYSSDWRFYSTPLILRVILPFGKS